jgi:hypothetical protein
MTTDSSYFSASSDLQGKPTPRGDDDGEGEAT